MGSPAALGCCCPLGQAVRAACSRVQKRGSRGVPRPSRPDGCACARALAKDGMLCERQRSRLDDASAARKAADE